MPNRTVYVCKDCSYIYDADPGECPQCLGLIQEMELQDPSRQQIGLSCKTKGIVVMKDRPKGFLSDENEGHDSEVFDYVVELHSVLWEFVRYIIPGASGHLRPYIDKALAIIRDAQLQLETESGGVQVDAQSQDENDRPKACPQEVHDYRRREYGYEYCHDCGEQLSS